MNKLLYSLLAVALAGCIWLYLEQQQTVLMMQQHDSTNQGIKEESAIQKETIVMMDQRIKELEDSVNLLTGQVDHLKNNPIVLTKTITKKNEKIIPISRTASEYYNSILSKRYQVK